MAEFWCRPSFADEPSVTHLVGQENGVFIQAEDGISKDDGVGEKSTAHHLERRRRMLLTIFNHSNVIIRSLSAEGRCRSQRTEVYFSVKATEVAGKTEGC